MAYFKNAELEKMLSDAELIIFDMNGLIVDDEEFQIEATRSVLNQFGIEISDDYWMKRCFSRNARDFLKRILEESRVKKYSLDDLIKQEDMEYQSLIEKKIKEIARKDVIQLINYLQGRKRIVVATNASPCETDIILDGLGIKDYFEFIITGDNVVKKKPNPEIYEKVAKNARVNPEKCLVFEDSILGVAAAEAAGMNCIAYPNKFSMNPDFKSYVKKLNRNAEVIHNG
jgi:HAD superfamily hydrolase (TIGR01509 family)